MADPGTLMFMGNLMRTASTVAETQAGRAMADADERIAKKNAAVVSAQAGQLEDAQRRQNRDLLARQRAAIAESGIGFGGSSRVLQEQTGAELELEALNIRYEGELRRRGFKAEQRLAAARKTAIGRTGFLKAGAQLLSAGADLSGSRIPSAT